MKKLLFTYLLTFVATCIWAQSESQTEYNFLRLPVSAHAAALGGENITMADDDAQMMFSNPALLIGVTPQTVTLNYMNYMSGCHFLSASYNMVVREKWNIGIGAQYINYGSMKQTDAYNTDLGTFSASDLALSGTLAYELARNIAGGVSVRYVYGKIASYSSMAVAVDLGVNWYLPETEWSMSLVAKNLGGQIQAYDNVFETMPLDVQFGISKRLIGSPLRLHATVSDINHPDYKFLNHLSVGADLIFSPQFYVAGGYSFRRANEMKLTDTDGNESANGAGLTLGAGLLLERFKINVAYGKYHAASSSIIANIAFTL